MFLGGGGIIFKTRRSKVTDYAALTGQHFECVNPLTAIFLCLMMTFANSFDPDQV